MMMRRQTVHLSVQAVLQVIALAIFTVMPEHRAKPADLFSVEKVGKKQLLLVPNRVEMASIRHAHSVNNVLASHLASSPIHFSAETRSTKHRRHVTRPVPQVWTRSAQVQQNVKNTHHARTDRPHFLL
jgi:hypothetical protein